LYNSGAEEVYPNYHPIKEQNKVKTDKVLIQGGLIKRQFVPFNPNDKKQELSQLQESLLV
jgi:hypothetical protein